MKTNYLLAISGNDIFSGGGLYADLATFQRHHLHSFLAVTCLTAMSDSGFEIFPTNENIFKKQLDSLRNVSFSAIKLGLLPNVEIADQALNFIKKYSHIPIILDPVLVCKEKHDTEVSALREELLKFFPYVTLITPNLVEAELLSQKKIQTLDDMKEVAYSLYQLGAKNIVIKGGNRFDKEFAIDLFYDGRNFKTLKSPVLDSNNIGAGCTFASSIASYLSLRTPIIEAVSQSKEFVYQAIQNSDEYGVKQAYD
ncbi:bifunctional hydroxymethylpyrimidine kinase/phosphomethylpyrimidine kinase [Streptococcus didelphis]|uniref:pyridoxal kinase n=1 Tax=Streptococcus didelphis TaxID=102886 RepID=A0ABY9LGG7_9STRE|nr:bifunctional hydroxymethylpyrimidine kinase/phosphomethylpyrimidine kinase [Streptococcus didelphis]WMB27957.1 bifunctional hydroxymethylpyrimidine kinase/phosphomethylpyrimidine kinase [Streptococcus didelphis]WMB29575.1 bifunctional hydroxymethylpyrimidine kinase/phosphomethylpyrimidine kinase [Streptococcus didelphis]